MRYAMSRLLLSLFTGVLGVLLALGSIQDAEAGRLGGGKSFGSRPAYSAPYQRTTPPATPSQARGAESTPAAAQNAAQRQALGNRGGLMGMLGGLALGGLLGALLFGGAFEGINFFDIALLGGLAALAYLIFASRRRRAAAGAPMAAAYGRAGAVEAAPADGPVMERASANGGVDASGRGAPSGPLGEGPVDVPPGFDTAGFLDGAKRAYRLLQEAWDTGDLGELRSLTTDDVFAELQDQLRARQGENRTTVLHLDARLLEARRVGGELEASVLFDAFLREVDAGSGPDDRGQQVKEVWHFIKPVNSRQPTWLLDGIQQMA